MILSEYRLGNIVQNKQGTICRISQLDGLQKEIGMSFSCDPPGFYYDSSKPVKITPTFLDMVGFKLIYIEEVARKLYIKDGISFTEDLRLCTHHGGLVIVSKTKHFIHEFQNLYFELTGEELEFDIKQL